MISDFRLALVPEVRELVINALVERTTGQAFLSKF